MSPPFFSTFQKRCEWLALFFLTTCFFVSQISISLTTITYLSAFLLLILSGQWRSRFNNIKNNKAALSFWLMLIIFIVGIFYSASPPHRIFHEMQKNHWLFITPFLISAINDTRWRERMINTFLCVMIVTLAIGYGMWFFNHGFIPIDAGGDRVNPFMGRIVQGFSMNVAAFICAYRFLFQKKHRFFYLAIFLLMGINLLYLNLGRTGYGLFFLILCYLGLMRFGWRGMLSAILISVTTIGALYFISPNFHTRIQKIYDHTVHYDQLKISTSIGQRVEMLHIAKKMIAKHPWFGYGAGGIRAPTQQMIPAQERVFNPSMDYVESIYINFLLEFGVAGLLVFLGAMVMQIRETFKLPHEYRCFMQVVLMAFLFGGLFNMFFFSFPITHLYSLFAAVCFSSRFANASTQ